MFLGRAVGVVWSTAKSPELEGMRFLLVRPYELDDLRSGRTPSPADAVVAADLLGAGPGEDVIVAFGHAARVALEPELKPFQEPKFPVDAAVVAIVDRWQITPATREPDNQPGGDR